MSESQEIAAELERQALLKDCHTLIAEIGKKSYANKRLRSARESLLRCLDYKANRQQRTKR